VLDMLSKGEEDNKFDASSESAAREVLIGVVFRGREDFGRFVERFEAQEPGIPVLLSTWVFEDPDGSVKAVFKVSEDRSIVERALAVYRTQRSVEIIERIPDRAEFLIGPGNGVEEPYTLDFKAFLRLLSLIGFTSAVGLRDLSKSSESRNEAPINTTSISIGRSEQPSIERPTQVAGLSPEEAQAVKRWVAEEYLEPFAGSARRILEEVVERLEIDPAGKRIALGARESKFNGFGDVRSAVASLLEDYRQTLGESFEKAVDAVAGIVIETISTVRRPTIDIVVKNISIREELADRLYRQVLDQMIVKTFRVGNNILGIYCYNEGVYEECEAEIKRMMWEMVKDNPDIRKKTIRWVINEALNRVMLETMYDLRYEPKKIAFKNVILDWEVFLKTGSLRAAAEPFNPEVIVFHKIPHKLALEKLEQLEGLLKYDEELAVVNLEELAARLCPRSLKAFKDWVGDKWILLFEIIGYTLYPEYILHKAVMLVGDGSNGKSTYLKLHKAILGSQNVISIPLQDLTEPDKRFVAAQLYRKLANIYADLPQKALRETGIFKVLTGEDYITADRKFRDPITFRNYAKMIFSANELPEVKDMTYAFWRRWIVIEFPNKFPEDPTFFERTFTEDEIEGIIIVALYAFRNVWIRKRFSFEESPEDYKRVWLRNVSSVYAFMEDLLAGKIPGYRAKLDPEGAVEKDTLYNLYVQYCNNEDLEAVEKGKFTKELERLYGIRTYGRAKKFYKGLRLESENDKQTKLVSD